MATTQQHALRDRWFFFYLPLITPDMVSANYNGDWKVAAEELTQHLDWVTTVEELWSSVNSLPKIQSLPVGSTYILSRDGKEASFENFPKGSRLLINLQKAPATDAGLDVILAAVLGEFITRDVGVAVPVCDVVRIAARPNREFIDLLRVEVWLNDATYSTKVTSALCKALKDRGITSSSYGIKENPFENAVTKAAGSPASPELDKGGGIEQAPKEAEPETDNNLSQPEVAHAAPAPEDTAAAEEAEERAKAEMEQDQEEAEHEEEAEPDAKNGSLERLEERTEKTERTEETEMIKEETTAA